MTDDELRSLFEAQRQETAALRTEVRQEIAALRQDNGAIREEIAGLRQDNGGIREEIAALRQDNGAIRAEAVAAHAETRRHFDVALEAARHETRLVAEVVADTRERLNRVEAHISEEVRRVAAETQAMIKFSHAELDRRVRTLEDAVNDLQSRVERLESTTH